MGIDITAYDCGRPCEFWPDPKWGGCSPLSGFELFSDRHPDSAKFANNFGVLPLQADRRQHFHISYRFYKRQLGDTRNTFHIFYFAHFLIRITNCSPGTYFFLLRMPGRSMSSFYYATIYLPIETVCYSVDHRKSYQQVKSWKLSRPSARRGLPGASSLHRRHRYRDDWLYDDCAADHVILPSFRW